MMKGLEYEVIEFESHPERVKKQEFFDLKIIVNEVLFLEDLHSTRVQNESEGLQRQILKLFVA